MGLAVSDAAMLAVLSEGALLSGALTIRLGSSLAAVSCETSEAATEICGDTALASVAVLFLSADSLPVTAQSRLHTNTVTAPAPIKRLRLRLFSSSYSSIVKSSDSKSNFTSGLASGWASGVKSKVKSDFASAGFRLVLASGIRSGPRSGCTSGFGSACTSDLGSNGSVIG